MTVLSACDQASKLMGFGALSTLIANTNPFAVELAALCNEAGPYIAKAHDWRKLMLLKTQAGDGSDTEFDLPTDYDRMPVKANIFLTSTSFPLTSIDDLDVWQDHRLRTFGTVGGEWIILGGSLLIYPAMASTDSAKYYYLSNKIVLAVDGTTTKTTFTVDTDTFRLPERLLTLALIWRWRAMKGYDYAEDMQNFEIAMAQEVARDKGSRILKIGQGRFTGDAALAFPGTVNG